MDELIDILDSEGNPTGKTAMKSEAHRYGWYHQSVHIWFYTANGKVLIQQRAANKDTHPLLWDVSVAGHIGAGEAVKTSALREIEEEIGLKVEEGDLQKIGCYPSFHEHSPELIDREFHHTFLCELKVPLHRLKKQESEVADLKLISLIQFSQETWGLANLGKYVPHGIEYYKTVVKEIKKRL
ncbi:NUDIX hydrolase [Pseudozobellia thermophila]|uniref:Isopentenyldiphosphate isomerase n=1 Tax=Pseudozobellia thermophila TaxID=192903 RepID=A0A1M6FCP3_9FLAO|nr:NUDIX domain-containing protein [Pseudozobellia thermophila]SHI95442.1 Isopentenyldiphosphate isomerase [Pseudozobellia thermophila]